MVFKSRVSVRSQYVYLAKIYRSVIWNSMATMSHSFWPIWTMGQVYRLSGPRGMESREISFLV
jgi:hypothetical protein